MAVLNYQIEHWISVVLRNNIANDSKKILNFKYVDRTLVIQYYYIIDALCEEIYVYPNTIADECRRVFK